MGTAHALVMLLLILGFPVLANVSVGRFKWLSWFSPVLQCYLFGVVLANLPWDIVHKGVAQVSMMASVPLAIPLLLFSTDLPGWLRLARRTLASFGLALLATVVVAAIAALTLSVPGAESWKVSGMMVGVYTGGTPNMSAIGWALDVEENAFILINTADMMFGGMFFFFLLTLAKPLLGRFMPPFPRRVGADSDKEGFGPKAPSMTDPAVIRQAAIALALSVAVVVASGSIAAGLAWLTSSPASLEQVLDAPIFNASIIVAISTLAIVLSLLPRVRGLKGSFELGDYCILVFCVAIGSQADVGQLAIAGLPYLKYVGLVMFGAVGLHITLAALFRIDVETAIITSTAAIYGPAFIGPVARALGNRELVVSGITSATVGLAVGTQLGLALAYLLQP